MVFTDKIMALGLRVMILLCAAALALFDEIPEQKVDVRDFIGKNVPIVSKATSSKINRTMKGSQRKGKSKD